MSWNASLLTASLTAIADLFGAGFVVNAHAGWKRGIEP